MAKDNNKVSKSDIESIQNLNKSFSSGYDALYSKYGVPAHFHELDYINGIVDKIISSELNNTKSITSDEMSTFLVKTFNDHDRNQGNIVNNIEDIFQSNDNALEQFFQDRYQNQNLLYEDLDMICQYLGEMDEAVATTRDAIITADDITKTVSRNIVFENTLSDDPNVANYMTVINDLETSMGLPKKIKNQIIDNCLKYGKYYVYTVPYTKLFEQQYAYKLSDPSLSSATSVKESLVESACMSIGDVVEESTYYENFIKDIRGVDNRYAVTASELKKSMEEYCSNITVTNDIFSIPLIEKTDVTQIMDSEEFKKQVELVAKSKNNKEYSDGTYDINKQVEGKFKNITGCYVKFIDPRKIVPVKILDTTLGYYYIHDTELRRDKAPFSTSIRVTNSVSPNGTYSDDVESLFMQRITDKIINAFDPRFVEKNQKFKDLILNALIYNDVYKRQLNFQFIPAEYMVEFNVNEDANGNGMSILKKSLFYAKLYLALLVFKMVSILNRSNDTRVYYIKNSGIDANITNKIQDTARSIKAKQINFMDVLNYNSIISKVGNFKDIFMPVGRSGDRGIEFDTIAGQNIDWNSDLMEFLRTNMINNSGVPSVIMNYINEADYARTLQMANTKFASRTTNLQLDFNPSLTKLYQNILKFTNSTIPQEYIDKLRYVLTPSKSLNNQNSADNLNTTDQLITALIKTKVGENDNSDVSGVVRDIMYDELARIYIPSIDWAFLDEVYKKAIMEAEQRAMDSKTNE